MAHMIQAISYSLYDKAHTLWVMYNNGILYAAYMKQETKISVALQWADHDQSLFNSFQMVDEKNYIKKLNE